MLFKAGAVHEMITDRICELENYIEGFSQEELQDDKCKDEVIDARYMIDELKKARFICDNYLY